MHPYIPHLISDIIAAQRPEGYVYDFIQQSFEEEMEEIERWVSGEDGDEHSFGYYCGLNPEQFPPTEQLSVADMEKVCKAFQHLLYTWNSGIDLPEKMPINLCYSFMVHTLEEDFTPVSSGFMTFDYCSGYAPDCVFGKYCSCLKYRNDVDKEIQ